MAGTTNHRSIGTKSAFTSGTLTVSGAGLILTIAGATWPADNGVGDEIDIDTGGTPETRHILSRDSDTQVTLQILTTKSGSGLAHDTHRTFSLLATWESTQGGDLVAGDRKEIGQAYNDSTFTANVSMTGNTTNFPNEQFMDLTVPVIDRHDGTEGTGTKTTGSITPFDNGDRVTYFEVNSSNLIRADDNEWAFTIVHEAGSGVGISAHSGNGANRSWIHHNFVYDKGTGILTRQLNGLRLSNNSVTGCTIGYDSSSFDSDGSDLIFNNAFLGNTTNLTGPVATDTTEDTLRRWWADRNAVETTGDMKKNENEIVTTASANFENLTGGSEDLRLKAGAPLLNKGYGPLSDPDLVGTEDILGTTLVGLTGDVGAHQRSAPPDIEFVSAGADEFVVADPTIGTIVPASGTESGGTSVVITGTNYGAVQGTGGVTVGGPAATIDAWADTEITITTPAGTIGDVDVVVTNDSAGAVTATDGYEYTAAVVDAKGPHESNTNGHSTLQFIGGNL